MFTPPKAAQALLGALALALLTSSAQADNPAYWTSKNGWSTEHSCKRDGEVERCWTMSRGKAVQYPGDAEAGANLVYECTTRNAEWLYISMYSTAGPRKDISTLKARWGRELSDNLATAVTKEDHRGKPLYFYDMEGSEDFIEKMKEHRTLNVFLPFSGGRPFEIRFKLANAIPSIQQTMKACGIRRSALGDIHR